MGAGSHHRRTAWKEWASSRGFDEVMCTCPPAFKCQVAPLKKKQYDKSWENDGSKLHEKIFADFLQCCPDRLGFMLVARSNLKNFIAMYFGRLPLTTFFAQQYLDTVLGLSPTKTWPIIDWLLFLFECIIIVLMLISSLMRITHYGL